LTSCATTIELREPDDMHQLHRREALRRATKAPNRFAKRLADAVLGMPTFACKLSKKQFPRKKGFCVVFWGSALHTAQPSQPAKRLLVEPMLGSLAPKMLHKQVRLAL